MREFAAAPTVAAARRTADRAAGPTPTRHATRTVPGAAGRHPVSAGHEVAG